MNTVKPKTPAIRATQPQTDLLKAAYTVSSTPLPQAIRELSEHTGLPEKWINNWFGRQRSKLKKAVDKTTDTVAALKTEHREVQLESDPPSSSPQSAARELPEPARKSTRRRAPRTRKPKAQNSKSKVKAEPKESPMPPVSAATVPLGRPPPSLPSISSSITHDQSQNVALLTRVPIILPATTPQSASNPKYPSGRSPVTNFAEVYSSTAYSASGSNCHQITSVHIPQGPIMRSSFKHSFADDYSFDSDSVSPPEKSLDSESQRPSSPPSSETEISMTTTRSGATIAFTSRNEPLKPAAQPAQRINATQPALSAIFNEDPAAYRTMFLPYAMLFPTLFPALAGAMTGGPSQVPESQSVAHSSVHSFSEEYASTSFSTDSPRLPAYTPYNEDLPPSSPPATDNESTMSPWISDSDHLDFSGLSPQDAPLYHLRERLEPFRLPESEYLFGREGVANHLLDDRLVVEEPFNAAMGLVLLSKLGLQW